MVVLDPLGTTILVAAVLGMAMVALLILLRLVKSGALQRALRAREEAETRVDRAYNTLVTTEAIGRELRDKGLESVQASALLEEARQAYYEGDPRYAEERAEEARALLQDVLQKDAEARVPAEEAPLLAELEEEIPEVKPVLGKEYPKNYLQAKFLLGVAKDRVKGAKKGSEEGKQARELAKEAQDAFEEERYTEALALALHCRRLLDGEDVGEPPVVEEKEEEACPECGRPVAAEDEFCGQCGAALAESLTCASCDAPLAADDNFCRKCGTPVKEAPEAR